MAEDRLSVISKQLFSIYEKYDTELDSERLRVRSTELMLALNTFGKDLRLLSINNKLLYSDSNTGQDQFNLTFDENDLDRKIQLRFVIPTNLDVSENLDFLIELGIVLDENFPESKPLVKLELITNVFNQTINELRMKLETFDQKLKDYATTSDMVDLVYELIKETHRLVALVDKWRIDDVVFSGQILRSNLRQYEDYFPNEAPKVSSSPASILYSKQSSSIISRRSQSTPFSLP
ncbi:hypothetical protein QR98_0032470 [Sarcoptes scabiei]|uniref:Uncharacterized protein n=1 Tax=Sarcoptes scabiei TaxID=52283 RepID=A0A132A1H6_SARSC|nr:hypothetical protein QR98_0032470 [Sarcoptes scabiei]